ncbi:hypothetical protein ACFE04_020502 [Oxalis oulophora]
MEECSDSSEVGMRRLSLIDFSSADDWLINSPFDNQKGLKTFQFLDDNALHVPPPPISIQQQPKPIDSPPTKNFNLRKSLAWDSAFFTSDGFLDADEISSMIGNDDEKTDKLTATGSNAGKSNKLMLPPIQEFLHCSTDSLSTLASETFTLQSSECDLFDDVRASIQKSSKKLTTTDGNNKPRSGTVRSSTKMDLATRNRLKPKVTPKKPGASIQVPVKVTQQVSKSIIKSGGSAPLVSKQPKVIARGGPVSTISAKRTSLGANRVKIEQDSGNATGKGRIPMPKAPVLGSLRNVVPRPAVRNSRPSSISSATSKRELRTSCSSLESSDSVSSSSITQASLNYLKKKINVNMVNTPSKATTKVPLRTAPKKQNQPGWPQISPSISPASSISEWSVDSSSSASTVNLTCNSSRFSVAEGSPQVFNSEKYSTKQSSAGSHTRVDESSKRATTGTGVLRPDSMKPTGLRMPSPKIGFFDGARSSGRTPNGTTQSQYGSPKVGSESISPSGNLNKIKLAGKPQIIKPSGKYVAQQTPKFKSPSTFKELSTKVSSTLRKNAKGSPISPEVQSIASLKIREECQVETKGGDMVIKGSMEKDSNFSDLKDGVKEKAYFENEVGCFKDEKSSAPKESADNVLPSHHQVSSNDSSIVGEKSMILVCTEKEEVASHSRIPFATMDSFCNSENLLDVSLGLTAGETEKMPVGE